jgi:hypothetical protein
MIREWMTCLVKALLASETGLFERCDTHEVAYKISESSSDIPHSSDTFLFMGKLMGKAVFDRIPLNLCLARPLYKAILGKLIEFADIKFLDECVSLVSFL